MSSVLWVGFVLLFLMALCASEGVKRVDLATGIVTFYDTPAEGGREGGRAETTTERDRLREENERWRSLGIWLYDLCEQAAAKVSLSSGYYR